MKKNTDSRWLTSGPFFPCSVITLRVGGSILTHSRSTSHFFYLLLIFVTLFLTSSKRSSSSSSSKSISSSSWCGVRVGGDAECSFAPRGGEARVGRRRVQPDACITQAGANEARRRHVAYTR